MKPIIKGGIFLTLLLIYEGHKYIRTRARPLFRKQMWEQKPLDVFQVFLLGCGPALHLTLRSGFLGSVQSRVATRLEPATDKLQVSQPLLWPKRFALLALICAQMAYFFLNLFPPLSSVKYAIPKCCLKNSCGKTWWLSFSANVLNNAKAIWRNILAYSLICNINIFSYMKQRLVW